MGEIHVVLVTSGVVALVAAIVGWLFGKMEGLEGDDIDGFVIGLAWVVGL